MKNSKYLLLALLSVSISFYSCDDDDDDNKPAAAATTTSPTQNIAEIAIGDSRTDSLVVALSQTGLVPTFQGTGTFTVFAPTNQAFRDLLSTNMNWNKIADIDNTLLTNVLLYHVLGSVVRAEDLTDDTYGTTLNTQGTSNNEATVLEVDVTGGVIINNNASVEQGNIDATNGVIHIIDAVIMPRNVVELALNDERFTSLVAALQVFGTTYTDVLSGTGPFTVFAPTNAAFQGLLDSNPMWNTLSDVPTTTLETVLRYHVISGSNERAGDLSQGETLSTLDNGTLTVDLTNGAQLMTSDTSQAAVNIIVTDVQGTNGVIHAVDMVLLP